MAPEKAVAVAGIRRFSVSELPVPDLEILVRTGFIGGSIVLTYELTTRDPKLGLNHHEFGPIKTRTSPQIYFVDFFEEVDKIHSCDPENKIDILNAKGTVLAKALLSRPLWGRLEYWV